MTTATRELLQAFETRIASAAFGLETVVRGLVAAAIVRGHVLLQGVPGTGKTLLARAFTRSLGGRFERVQCTADLMPSDLTGVHVFDAAKRAFVLRPGPLFGDVVLVDEINRSGPKTQSAMLQAMEERAIAIDRKVYSLSPNFLVVATQNPHDFEGTYPLPESQLDRFVMMIELSYPGLAAERAVLAAYDSPSATYVERLESIAPVAASLLDTARAEVSAVHVTAEVYDYALAIAAATRVNARISLGLSTRGVLALMRCARAEAALSGRDFVSPDDIKTVANAVIAHRLVLAPDASLDGVSAPEALAAVLGQVKVPRA